MSIRNETINRLSLPSPLHLSHYFPIVQPFPVKLLFSSHHLVHIAVLRMPAFQSRPQQHRAELHGIAATHQGGMLFLQLVKDVGGSQVDALLCRKRGTEQAANRLLGKADTIESLVVPLQFLLLRLGEPARRPAMSSAFSWAKIRSCSMPVQSMSCFTSMQRKRRLPVGSVSRSKRLLVPMNEAIRGVA